MKNNYKFGEILLYVREEYRDCKRLFDELNKCICVSDNENFYFDANLSKEESKIKLIVEKKYSELLKKIEWLKYNWYSKYLYTACFDVVKNENNSEYTLKDDSIENPISNDKRFTPSVDVVNQEEFNDLVDKILSLDIMNVKNGAFNVNQDCILLNCSNVLISSSLGYKSLLSWNGSTDLIDYSIKKNVSPSLLEKILYLEIPTNNIAPEWLQIFEKHENNFKDEMIFDVDHDIARRSGQLQIDSSNNEHIKLLRK